MKTPGYLRLYAAQLPVLGRACQTRLRRARVHVCGCGGIGSQIILNLAAVGVGRITANDPQAIAIDNFNRFALATLDDINLPKVTFLKKLLAGRPYLKFDGLAGQTEDPGVIPYCEGADLLVCCSTTVESRIRAARLAVTLNKPIIDVSVADGRRALAGFIKIRRPQESSWSACPACYLENTGTVARGEGLLSTVIATTAGLATHFAVLTLARPRNLAVPGWNLFVLDFTAPRVETLAVEKRPHCPACST